MRWLGRRLGMVMVTIAVLAAGRKSKRRQLERKLAEQEAMNRATLQALLLTCEERDRAQEAAIVPTLPPTVLGTPKLPRTFFP